MKDNKPKKSILKPITGKLKESTSDVYETIYDNEDEEYFSKHYIPPKV